MASDRYEEYGVVLSTREWCEAHAIPFEPLWTRARGIGDGMKHYYVSTYCLHELHDGCRRTCKHCRTPCLCPCHAGQEVTDGK